MKKYYDILLVDDHSLLRQAVKAHIELENSEYKVDEAMNGEHALQRLGKKDYDLIITDINMPKLSGIELVNIIRKKHNDIKALVVSMYFDSSHVSQMLTAGVDGYVSKNANHQELLKAIQTILDGGTYYSGEISKAIMDSMNTKRKDNNILETLSDREKEILYLVLKEFSNKEIAKKLKISTRTVETHKYNLLQKTQSKNIAGLFRFAMKYKLFADLV